MNDFEDSYDDMDIQHFKLVDGNEIIGYINSSDNNKVFVERPMTLNLAMALDGHDTYYFTKYMPFTKENIVTFHLNNIVSFSEVRNDIKETYIRAALKVEIKDSLYDLDNEMDVATDEEMDLNYMEPISKKIH